MHLSNHREFPVDYCASGVKIRSLYEDNQIAILSGTLLVSSHVVGLLLLLGNEKVSIQKINGMGNKK